MKKKKEKGLCVALIDPVGGHGGMDLYDFGLLSALSSIDPHASFLYYTCSKTQVLPIDRVHVHPTYKNLWSKRRFALAFLFFCYNLKTVVHAKRSGADSVHYQFFSLSFLNFSHLLIARLFFKHIVVTLHDVEDLNQSNSKLIRRLSIKLIRRIIVHNQASLEEILKLNIDRTKTALIPHGSYVDFYTKLPFKKRSDEFYILFFGQLKRAKGLDVLIYAFAKASALNPRLRLKIVGRPWKMETESLLHLIDDLQLKDRVSLNLNYIKNEDISSTFESADLIVLPYRKIYQSGVLLLSASLGRPVLTSDLSAFREFVTDGVNGFLFRDGDVDDLSSKMVEIAERDDLQQIVNNADLTLLESYNWKKSAAMTLGIYRSLASAVPVNH